MPSASSVVVGPWSRPAFCPNLHIHIHLSFPLSFHPVSLSLFPSVSPLSPTILFFFFFISLLLPHPSDTLIPPFLPFPSRTHPHPTPPPPPLSPPFSGPPPPP